MPNVNWLRNPGFEGAYVEQDGIGEVKVADGWRAWWNEGLPPAEHSQGPCQRPEYIAARMDVDRGRVIQGARAQGWCLRFKVMDAGVYQHLTGLPVGREFVFSVYAHTWCSDRDDPRAADGEMYLTLGVDQTGGINPRAVHVRWTEWERLTADYRDIMIEGRTAGPSLTIFVRAWNKWKLSHNDVYIDDAGLTIADDDEPPPDPEPSGYWAVFADERGERETVDLSDHAEYTVSGDGRVVEFRDGGRAVLVPTHRLVVAVVPLA